MIDSVNFLQKARSGSIELRLFKDGDHRLTAFKDEVTAREHEAVSQGSSVREKALEEGRELLESNGMETGPFAWLARKIDERKRQVNHFAYEAPLIATAECWVQVYESRRVVEAEYLRVAVSLEFAYFLRPRSSHWSVAAL